MEWVATIWSTSNTKGYLLVFMMLFKKWDALIVCCKYPMEPIHTRCIFRYTVMFLCSFELWKAQAQMRERENDSCLICRRSWWCWLHRPHATILSLRIYHPADPSMARFCHGCRTLLSWTALLLASRWMTEGTAGIIHLVFDECGKRHGQCASNNNPTRLLMPLEEVAKWF